MRPPLFVHEAFYWQAFHELSTCRQVGMILGPIPWAAIRDYCEDLGIDDEDERADFTMIIRLLDDVYLKIAEERTKAGGG